VSVPKIILELVERFDRHREAYLAGKYNEAQLRQEFINPFFKALGWDIDNEQGNAEAYKDVIHEDAIKIGSATKAPDYCFRIGGTRKFFLEAKKPSIDIKGDSGPAYQLRRYAWSAKLPLSVLTDFEEFAIYDCRVRPMPTDKSSNARIKYYTYIDYAEKWDEIASVFSKDAVLKGSFDKYAESARGKKGTAQVDDAFLAEIESWRDELAHNIALRNPKLDSRQLNFAVQMTIDRIIFLRICEDRGVERYGELMGLFNGDSIYQRLLVLFRKADDRYNSGLFHFSKEKERPESPDELTPNLAIDDKVLKGIFKRLYYPDSPYEFSVLPAEILGQVYEQFLGKVITLTAGHHAKVEDKPEVKKAGGVFYTPAYIVDYIVQNTVGKLVEGKTPKEVEKIKILDPACGSGSFLLGAYQFLLDWHLKWYLEHSPEQWAKVKNPAVCVSASARTEEEKGGHGGLSGRSGQKTQPPIHRGRLWATVLQAYKLTLGERKKILLNNIFGVDIDTQAVEVTKLSLLLKVLEGEKDLSLFARERALPDLGQNIKCGNSLIGPDFYHNQQGLMFDDDEQKYKINAFDWQAEFKEIFSRKNGGFDAVIGNPPWGATFWSSELDYLRIHYSEVISRMIDSYIYFIAKAIKLANSNSFISFIVPSTVLNQVDAKPVRELLLSKRLSCLISLGQGIFGSKVLNTSTIFSCGCYSKKDEFVLSDLSTIPLQNRQFVLFNKKITDYKRWETIVKSDPHLTLFVGEIATLSILERLRQEHPPLENILLGGIQRGISPDIVAAHVLTSEDTHKIKIEKELLRRSISGSQIKRYKDWSSDQNIIYTTKDTPIDKYPGAKKYLLQFRDSNTCPEVAEKKHPFWALHRPRNATIFNSPKFIGITTSKAIELIYDENQSLFVTDAMYVFSIDSKFNPYVVLAVLQSKIFLCLYRIANQGESRVIPQVKASKLETIPFPKSFNEAKSSDRLDVLVREMYTLHKKLALAKTPNEKTVLQRQIDGTDNQIDRLVYELYGLTEEEIKLVEESTK
jgi:hypothetical protein